MPVLDASSPLEDGVTGGARASAGTAEQAKTGENELLSDTNLLKLAQESDRVAKTFAQTNWLGQWDRNYKAFRSEHFDGSKYRSADYRNRSRLFRPKTRSAVIKDLASTAGSLFATINAVTASAGDDSDPVQRANAAVQQELINYRLDRTSGRNSIPWFLTAMGARQDALIAAICCSKQSWDYIAKDVPQPDIDGKPQPPKKKVVRDKPSIELVPPENVGLHPAAHWMDPVNDGAFFNAWFPMTVGDVKEMALDPKFPWVDVTDDQIKKARVRQFESGQVRRARGGGKDPAQDQETSITDFDVVWVCERFVRIEGDDYCYWTLADQTVLSEPSLTEDVYPEFSGERPYRIGYGALEAHRIVPQSMVETVQPLQQEVNDLVNLRLDNVKEALKPLTLVKRGKKVDLERLKRRGQNTTMLVDDVENDIKFDRPDDVTASSYTEMERLNVDFDDLAGVFNSGSVQSNRTLNETVGGMKLLSGAANAVTEFNIRVWVETWVEPVLSQLAKLEAYYESDEKVLALAKKRAGLFKRFGVDELTDEMLSQEVYVRVSAGVGSPDPMQKLEKMGVALKTFEAVAKASPEFATGEIKPNIEEFANEIFGNAGIRDAFDRFFTRGQPMPQPGEAAPAPQGPSPEELAMQAQDGEAERKNKMDIARLGAQTKIVSQLIDARTGETSQRRDIKDSARHKMVDVLMDSLLNDQQARQSEQQMAQRAQQRMAGPGPAPSVQ